MRFVGRLHPEYIPEDGGTELYHPPDQEFA